MTPFFAELEQACFYRFQHRPRTVAHAELGQNTGDVVFDRAFGFGQGRGDFAIAVTAGHQAQHLGFFWRQRLCLVGAKIVALVS